MSIKSQIITAFGLLLLLTISTSALFSLSISRIVRYEQLAVWSAQQLAAVKEIRIALHQQRKCISDYLLFGDEAKLKALDSTAATVRRDLDKVREMVALEIAQLEHEEERQEECELRHSYDELSSLSQRMTTKLARIAGLKKAGDDRRAAELFRQVEQDAVGQQQLSMIDEVISTLRKQGEVRTARQVRSATFAKSVALWSCLAAEVIVLVAMAIMFRSLNQIRRAEQERESLRQQLPMVAHRAGMSEIATGALHNIGNLLNSVNTSVTRLDHQVKTSRLGRLKDACALIDEHSDRLDVFFGRDEKGRRLPGYLVRLAEHLLDERELIRAEVDSLSTRIGHIKDVVRTQQIYAGGAGMTVPCGVAELIEDALKMAGAPFARQEIRIVRDCEPLPPVMVEKAKVLQILVNLITNAKQALNSSETAQKVITLRARVEDGRRLRLEVADNGAGIAKENLTKIFAHGFTTKKGGHGFGLHSACNAAKEAGGSLTAVSEGPGKGARFIFQLPFKPAKEVALA